jgi:hypothetical protein
MNLKRGSWPARVTPEASTDLHSDRKASKSTTKAMAAGQPVSGRAQRQGGNRNATSVVVLSGGIKPLNSESEPGMDPSGSASSERTANPDRVRPPRKRRTRWRVKVLRSGSGHGRMKPSALGRAVDDRSDEPTRAWKQARGRAAGSLGGSQGRPVHKASQVHETTWEARSGSATIRRLSVQPP